MIDCYFYSWMYAPGLFSKAQSFSAVRFWRASNLHSLEFIQPSKASWFALRTRINGFRERVDCWKSDSLLGAISSFGRPQARWEQKSARCVRPVQTLWLRPTPLHIANCDDVYERVWWGIHQIKRGCLMCESARACFCIALKRRVLRVLVELSDWGSIINGRAPIKKQKPHTTLPLFFCAPANSLGCFCGAGIHKALFLPRLQQLRHTTPACII